MPSWIATRTAACVLAAHTVFLTTATFGQILDKQSLLENETWWDNRDFDWYNQQIPFFECPDADIQTTYYYRWDLLTKHVTYGSPNSGYTFTEFIDRPFWSGTYGAISCPAGHQLYEARWLRSPRIANDYARYWFRTPGAQPRNYSTWLADSIWAVHQVHPDEARLVNLLPDLVSNQEAWERRHFVAEVGLFWQTGHDDGMEFNINSRQTPDILRGAPSYRPSFNAYMWAEATAMAKIARVAGDSQTASQYSTKAKELKSKMIERMWDPQRKFFFPLLKNDEHRDGHMLRALTRTYESGQYAGDSHGRELIGYVPWQFNLLRGDHRFDIAWKKLMDRDGFYADFGPSTVERNDPMFLLKNSCCWWSGQSWPYATSQTLKGLANLLQNGGEVLSAEDYADLLAIYARSHRKNGKPYLAEALHPDTGSFKGHDAYNHSEHYLHSGYCDQIVTGLAGLIPRDDDTLEVSPLVPANWDFFALDEVPYRGHLVSVVWDRNGDRYQLGKGLHLLVDGTKVASSPQVTHLRVPGAVPISTKPRVENSGTPTNFAVNNDGTYFPRLTASYTSSTRSSLPKLNDGNYWYMLDPPNRWSCEGSPNAEDWVEIDFGVSRLIDCIKLYTLDDTHLAAGKISVPNSVRLEGWKNGEWHPIDLEASSDVILGHRPHTLSFVPRKLQRLRVTLEHSDGFQSGLTELEAWGVAKLPLPEVPPPSGNLAYNDGKSEFPKATASFHDRFGGVPRSAIDGRTSFLPSPTNRWTSFGSPNDKDWLEIAFGKAVEFRRVTMAIYDDRGGVQAPLNYEIEVWKNGQWNSVSGILRSPREPLGGEWNEASFSPETADRIRISFTHRETARSGVSEVMIWNQ